MVVVSDPSQRCHRESTQTGKPSEVRTAIESTLKGAGFAALPGRNTGRKPQQSRNQQSNRKRKRPQEPLIGLLVNIRISRITATT